MPQLPLGYLPNSDDSDDEPRLPKPAITKQMSFMLSQLPDGPEGDGPEAALLKLEGKYEVRGNDEAFMEWSKTFAT